MAVPCGCVVPGRVPIYTTVCANDAERKEKSEEGDDRAQTLDEFEIASGLLRARRVCRSLSGVLPQHCRTSQIHA